MVDFKAVFLAILIATVPAAAFAAAGPLLIKTAFLPQIAIGFGASTLGGGVTANMHNPGDLFGGSVQANLFHFNINFSQNAAKSKAQATLQNESLLFDYYPWRQHFHLSAGVVFNQNNASFTTTPQLVGSLLGFVNRTHYTGTIGNMHGPITFNPIAPYLGAGYSWDVAGNWSFDASFGAMYQGNGHITLTSTGLMASNPQMRAGLEANATRANKMLDKMSFYPILSLDVTYRF